MRSNIPTSAALAKLLTDAPSDSISLGWLMGRLQNRSFGLLMLVLAILGLVPGIASFSGFFLAIPAVQMMLGRDSPTLPGFLARRTIPTRHFVQWTNRAIPVFQYLEAFVRPRFRAPFRATTRLAGFIDLILALTIILPFPFAYIVPTLAIVLISFSCLEEDGILLFVSLVAALLSLAITTVSVWAVVRATGFMANL